MKKLIVIVLAALVVATAAAAQVERYPDCKTETELFEWLDTQLSEGNFTRFAKHEAWVGTQFGDYYKGLRVDTDWIGYIICKNGYKTVVFYVRNNYRPAVMPIDWIENTD